MEHVPGPFQIALQGRALLFSQHERNDSTGTTACQRKTEGRIAQAAEMSSGSLISFFGTAASGLRLALGKNNEAGSGGIGEVPTNQRRRRMRTVAQSVPHAFRICRCAAIWGGPLAWGTPSSVPSVGDHPSVESGRRSQRGLPSPGSLCPRTGNCGAPARDHDAAGRTRGLSGAWC